jgi:hypothetical protein
MLGHRYLEGSEWPSVKFMYFQPIKIMVGSFAPNGATGYH